MAITFSWKNKHARKIKNTSQRNFFVNDSGISDFKNYHNPFLFWRGEWEIRKDCLVCFIFLTPRLVCIRKSDLFFFSMCLQLMHLTLCPFHHYRSARHQFQLLLITLPPEQPRKQRQGLQAHCSRKGQSAAVVAFPSYSWWRENDTHCDWQPPTLAYAVLFRVKESGMPTKEQLQLWGHKRCKYVMIFIMTKMLLDLKMQYMGKKHKVKPKARFVYIKAIVIKIYYVNCFTFMPNYLATQ